MEPIDVLKKKIKFQTEVLKLLVALFAGSLGGTVGIIRSMTPADGALITLGILFAAVFIIAGIWMGSLTNRMIQGIARSETNER